MELRKDRIMDVTLRITSNNRIRQTLAHAANRRPAYRLPDCIKEEIEDGARALGELLQVKERLGKGFAGRRREVFTAEKMYQEKSTLN